MSRSRSGGFNSAPSPPETVLVALIGRNGVKLTGVASARGFTYPGVNIAYESQIDVRNPKVVPDIRPHFVKPRSSTSPSTPTKPTIAFSSNSAGR